MNKLKYLNIIFLFFGITLYANASASKAINQVLQDSVYIDVDPIEKRHFEDLKDKYSGNDFIYERTINNSGWWTRFKQWLSDFIKNIFDINSDAKASDVTDIAIKVFYVVIFILVVFFIVKAIINKEGKWVFGKSSDKSIIPVTDIESNIYEADFKSLIASAERDNNYRLAVRYYYLLLLKNLSQAEIIEYDVEKTNSDYHYEINSEALKKEFSYTSYLYNYIWYGEFDIDNSQFQKAKTAFNQFLDSVK
ncbi:DUF4129 domain-containing protein [Winogradskyella poriferorum]|uniref:DUF4129 domain-containing protein n=1 Tax=Winogradskyella poriferorum TaxID=307627 RepID=UPI003D64E95B